VSHRTLTVLTPCFNEVANVGVLAERVAAALADQSVDYRHVFIDNASTDGTGEALRALAAQDPRVAVILNQRNFGHVRSPYHGLLQSPGDAVIVMAADLQDPPELIPEFLQKWREGFRVVLGQKLNSEESWLFFNLRRSYYKLVKRLADVDLDENATGFGLYDRTVIEQLRARAQALATRLGTELRGICDAMRVRGPSIDAAIDTALAASAWPVVFADGADNAGGGAPSDATWVLRRLVERNVDAAVIGIVDHAS
jgi:glycosyltransferase involved in cell wall biosynthesis